MRKIEAGPKGGRLLFNDRPDVDSDKVIRLIREQPQHYKLDGNNRPRFSWIWTTPNDASIQCRNCRKP